MRLLPALAFVLALVVASPPAAEAQHRGARAAVARRAPPAATNWLRHVERTAEGGYRMGNPNARLKLVEYGSITCPHCAEFAESTNQPLRDRYIRTGQVSFEYRPYMIFPTDPGIFLLLGCQSPGKFFDTVDQLYATQEGWSGRMRSHADELRGMAVAALVPAAVRASGVDSYFTQHGLSRQQVDSCLADQAGLQRLMNQNRAAEAAGVQGTPTLFLNGRMIEAANWVQLEAALSRH